MNVIGALFLPSFPISHPPSLIPLSNVNLKNKLVSCLKLYVLKSNLLPTLPEVALFLDSIQCLLIITLLSYFHAHLSDCYCPTTKAISLVVG